MRYILQLLFAKLTGTYSESMRLSAQITIHIHTRSMQAQKCTFILSSWVKCICNLWPHTHTLTHVGLFFCTTFSAIYKCDLILIVERKKILRNEIKYGGLQTSNIMHSHRWFFFSSFYSHLIWSLCVGCCRKFFSQHIYSHILIYVHLYIVQCMWTNEHVHCLHATDRITVRQTKVFKNAFMPKIVCCPFVWCSPLSDQTQILRSVDRRFHISYTFTHTAQFEPQTSQSKYMLPYLYHIYIFIN